MSKLFGPTNKSLRDMMLLVLKVDAQFEAFCIDCFPDAKKEFSSGMTRTEKENVLFGRFVSGEIFEKLKEWTPDAVRQCESVLQWTTVPSAKRPGFQREFSDLIQTTKKEADSCLDRLELLLDCNGARAVGRFHFVKVGADGRPQLRRLYQLLNKKLAIHCLAARTRQRLREVHQGDDAIIWQKARKLLQQRADSEEVGEMLLSLILEAFYGAPQVVCKMDLKPSPHDSVQGASGIHARWAATDDVLQLLFAKSHMHSNIASAIDSALRHIEIFCERKLEEREMHLVTAQYQFLDEEFRALLTTYLENPNGEHACNLVNISLVGFDWEVCRKQSLVDAFRDEYSRYARQIHSLLDLQFASFSQRHLVFEFLFLPFASVRDFRDAFYQYLSGTADR